MRSQSEQANLFSSLHKKGDPLILFNIWDAGSAKALQECGAKAIATGSWSVAAAHGYEDGQYLPLEAALKNAEEIVAAVDLPVTIDFEAGYGRSPVEVRSNVSRLIQTGAVGINFEDQIIGGDGLYSIADQVARIRAIREAANSLSVPFFINARSDVFLKASVPEHNESHLEEAVRRAEAYADAGASGFFAPGMQAPELIQKLCDRSPLPVNILMRPVMTFTSKELGNLGVARISYGPFPYRQMIVALKEAASRVISPTN